MRERHPLSAAWGDMPEKDFRALVEDVREHGVREQISLSGGQVVDGWHRYRAAIECGQDPPERELAPTLARMDLIRLVASRNLHRRHLTDLERAKAVQRCMEWRAPGDPRPSKRVLQGPSPTGSTEIEEIVVESDLPATAKEVAEIADVSPRTVKTARRQISEERGVARGRSMMPGAGGLTARPAPRPREKSEVETLREENTKLRLQVERLTLEANSARRAKIQAEGRLREAQRTIQGLNKELAAARGELFEP